MAESYTVSEMENWKKIKEYLLHNSECSDIHKMVWTDVAYVTLRTGRHKITPKTSLEQLIALIKNGRYR